MINKKHGKTVNQKICVKNFDRKKGGWFTCLDCPEECYCETLLRIRGHFQELDITRDVLLG